MSDIRRPADTRITRQPAADVDGGATRRDREPCSELEASRAGAVLLAGAAGAPAMRAAEVLAASLGASVVRVDLEAVVSKYIGETEKHLDAVFTDAGAPDAVLLMDEADALLGRRTGVKDAHDRYANLDMSALLARIEAYPGLVLLATNTTATVDPARSAGFGASSITPARSTLIGSPAEETLGCADSVSCWWRGGGVGDRGLGAGSARCGGVRPAVPAAGDVRIHRGDHRQRRLEARALAQGTRHQQRHRDGARQGRRLGAGAAAALPAGVRRPGDGRRNFLRRRHHVHAAGAAGRRRRPPKRRSGGITWPV